MSTFGDNIRKIAKYQELLDRINQAQETADQATKSAITANRSIAYLNKETLATAATSGAVGVLQPNGALGANGVTTEAAVAGAAQAVSSANPLNGATNSGTADDLTSGDNTDKEGWYDAESLLNNVKDAFGKTPANAAAREAVNTMTGLKTDDGTRDIILHFRDGAYVGADSATDAYSSGVDPTWVAGRVWAVASGFTQYFGATFSEMIAAREAVDGSVIRNYSGLPGPQLDEAVAGSNICTTFAPVYNASTIYNFEPYSPGVTVPIVGRYGQQDCGLVGGDGAACAITNPKGPWNDLGATQLAWVSTVGTLINPLANLGRFVPNPNDVNVPTIYADGSSILDLKTLDGTNVRVGSLATGGWYLYARDPSADNAPLGSANAYSVYTLDSKRQTTGFITPAQLTKLLPI